MRFVFNDGGRESAGYKGEAGDCVTRAIAIALELPYQEVYDFVNAAGKDESGRRKRRGKTVRSGARTGVYKPTTRQLMEDLGWVWHPTMAVGKGCTVHLRESELPGGRLVVAVSKHLCAVIDGELHDTHDCSREGTRCVYGYWTKG